MFYHVFRSKKAVRAGACAGGFDATDYCTVLERFMAEQQIIQQAAQNGMKAIATGTLGKSRLISNIYV